VRKLLRGRQRAGVGVRLIARLAASAALVVSALAIQPAWAQDARFPEVKITSPLGRTGLPGTIRIVARLEGPTVAQTPQVHFYVDGELLATDTDGSPFDALWNDDNPFERRELSARAEWSSGLVRQDSVVLAPLEVTQAVEVTSIAVEATVMDEKGRFVKDLDSEDFALFEDDDLQELDLTAQSREPALFALLVDGSQSMAIRSDAVRAASARLIDALGEEDQILVAPFTRTITSVTGPTTDRATVLDAIAGIRHAGGTAILDALGEAATTLSGTTRRQAVVLITDGYDEDSASKFDEAIEKLRDSSLTLYVIGLGGVAGISLQGEQLLLQLAEETGGHAWFPRDERQLLSAYEAIAADVQHRYLLTYTPTNQRRDGSWRAISVTVPGSHARVQARKGYTAPIAPPIRASLEFTGVGAGQTPLSLTREDLVVLEDGVPQEVDVFHEAVLPVTFMLALDASGSMKRNAERAQDAAREFIQAMRPEDEVGMILFATESAYIHSPTTRRDWSLDAIDGYVAEGGTALYDALWDSLAQLASVPGRRVVVVVTDGRDENAPSTGPGSLRSWEDVLAQLEKTDAAIYAVGIGSNVDQGRLRQLAGRSGGAAYFPTDVTTLSADYAKILDELRRRYVVGFESTNRSRDGVWRKVEIRPNQAGVEIRSRGGYFPPLQ
jgi:VWFA-related protein